MKGLTKRQQEITHFISEFIAIHRYSPSYREIMRHFGFKSLGTVYRHLSVLKRKGFLLSEKNCSRSLSLAHQLPSKVTELSELTLPLIGQIRGGRPIETFAKSLSVSIPKTMVHSPERTYALRVQGESLAEEFIADGDLLIVEAREEAHAGETVLALINKHDTVVKRYFPNGNYVRLLGNNPLHHPIHLKKEDVRIQGILVGLQRTYG